MENKYNESIKTLDLLESNIEKVLFGSSIIRSLLQLGVIVSLECLDKYLQEGEIDLSDYKSRMQNPSDGLPVEILDSIVPHLRQFVDVKYADGWFEKKKLEESLTSKVNQWVQFRNRTTGHGVLDLSEAKVWAVEISSIITMLLSCFEYLLPKIDGSNQYLSSSYDHLSVVTPLTYNNKPYILSKVTSKKSIWKMNVQTLSHGKKNNSVIELPSKNVFTSNHSDTNQVYDLSEIHIKDNSFAFFHNIPIPQTTTFEGREKEILELTEWLTDDDSKVCLIFGDGGYGKTTLILEFLNKLKNDELDLIKPIPEIISYHTSKMTRWTDDGLIHLKGKNNVVEDCIRQLMTAFESPLDKSWYTTSGKSLINKAKGVLQKNGYNRDDILLVIDNAETLATSQNDVQDLATTLTLIKKSLARVIITSRRKETIEAAPIEVKELTESEAVRLIRRLAEEYGANSINKSGSARVKKLVKQLMYKPLLIDCLVRYIARTQEKIDVGLESLFGKSTDELLEFLYEDAWSRIGSGTKKVFLSIVSISCLANNDSISKICQEIEVPLSEFMASFEETYFGSMTDYGYRYELELVPLAENFFKQKLKKLNVNDQEDIKIASQNVDEYIIAKNIVEQAYKSDRVAEAFKSEWAKAGKVSCDKGENIKAKEYYDLAVLDDPYNAALYDRYALFLLNKMKNTKDALSCAKKSIELDDSNGDSYLTLAMINYRKDDLQNGDKAIRLALENDKSKTHCTLAMGVARYHYAVRHIKQKNIIEMLEEANSIFSQALKMNSKDDRYYDKNREEITKYKSLTLKRINKIRHKK